MVRDKELFAMCVIVNIKITLLINSELPIFPFTLFYILQKSEFFFFFFFFLLINGPDHISIILLGSSLRLFTKHN